MALLRNSSLESPSKNNHVFQIFFSDSAPAPFLCNGTSPHGNLSNLNSRPGPTYSTKVGVRKRKTAAEKFLEDNADYYGIQVLPSKLRNHSSSHIPNPPKNSPPKYPSHTTPLTETLNSLSRQALLPRHSSSDLTSFSWITLGCRQSCSVLSSKNATNHRHSCHPSRSNSMDLGVVGTATTTALQAGFFQDDKTGYGITGHVQVLITVQLHTRKDTIIKMKTMTNIVIQSDC